MENDILKVLTVINQTANDLYPDKYVVTVSDNGNPGLYYPEAKRIVSPIDFTEDGVRTSKLTALFFNNCNDLMDDFIAIENEVNRRLEKLNLNLSLNLKENHDENKDCVSDDIEHEHESQNDFYVLKLGDYFMKANTQLATHHNPKLTDDFENALVFTDDDYEDEFKDAVEYYLAKGFKMCKINLEEV